MIIMINRIVFLIIIFVTTCSGEDNYQTKVIETLSMPFDNEKGVPTYYAEEAGVKREKKSFESH